MNEYLYTNEIEYDNIWLICLNCEAELSMDDCFFDLTEDNLIDEEVECPFCQSKQLRMESE